MLVPVLTLRENHYPLINDESYRATRFGPQLRFNRGVPRFTHQNEEYGCFETSQTCPNIQHIVPLQSLQNGRYHTYYCTSLEYDGNPYYQVLFLLIDTHEQCLYESWVIGRAAECSIQVDPNTYGFTLHYGNQNPIFVDEYDKKLGAALQCAEVMRLNRTLRPHRAREPVE